jgi:hypothetical protein
MASTRYGHFIKKLKFEKDKSGPKGTAIPDYRARMEGKDPHVHPSDEALLFVGCDPKRSGYLGAEIQIEMGQERETHVFDYPAVVVAPVGFVHCPLITRKVEKPYIFSAICLNTTHDTTWLGTGKFPWEQ